MSRDTQTEPLIPALRYSSLTRLYDPVVRWTLREDTFKSRLVTQARIQSGFRVLDLGCGTGTLTLMAQQRQPDAEVVGLDGDPAALGIARGKAEQFGIGVRFDQGMSYELPYPADTFDRVLSSLLFHHLTHKDKLRTLREVARVLRPDGELHLADWGRARNVVMRACFMLVQLLDGFRTTEENVRGELPNLMIAAGLTDVRIRAQYATVFGTIALYSARCAR